MTQISRKFNNWIPDVADHRDRLFTLHPALPPYQPAVAPLGKNSKREDQGQLGSCTGNGSTTAIETVMGWNATDQVDQLSRLMAYYNARVLEHTVTQDAGAMIRDVFKAALATGIARETTWPYDISKFAHRPSTAAFKSAHAVRDQLAAAGIVYERVTSLDGMLHAISGGSPVVFGFSVPESFMSRSATSLLQPLPQPGEKILGGHCVYADGYDVAGAYFWVGNSWGHDWGQDGYFQMPFAWFTDPRRLVDDMWTVRKTK